MNPTAITYATYLLVALPLTLGLACLLLRNGRAFLNGSIPDGDLQTESLSRLLAIGFLLVNLGFVFRYLSFPGEVANLRSVFEIVTRKLGVVMIFLGVTHFSSLMVLARVRRRTIWDDTSPPVMPER